MPNTVLYHIVQQEKKGYIHIKQVEIHSMRMPLEHLLLKLFYKLDDFSKLI